MKLQQLTLCYLIGFALLLSLPFSGETQTTSSREIIIKAMRDELNRNMAQLRLENLKDPFFISYTVRDLRTFELKATLGSLISSDEDHKRKYFTRIIIGDQKRTNENYFDMSGDMFGGRFAYGSDELPLEDDYFGIRRALWISTDRIYKSNAETFERKEAALKQQTLTEEEAALFDFSSAPVVKHTEPERTFTVDKKLWEQRARELSNVFRDYPDIYASEVKILFIQGDNFFVNSESSETVVPLTLAMIQVNAHTQAEDGEELIDNVAFYGLIPDEFPDLDHMKKQVVALAQELQSLRTAPVFNESYTGPVLFEDQAVAELVAQRLFHRVSGLVAFRKPLINDPRMMSFLSSKLGDTLDKKIGKRILAKDITVKAVPGKKEFAGTNLIGSYTVDAEGVTPPQEVVLVENGILKTFLTGRVPNLSVSLSNGHQRPVINAWSDNMLGLGPSVISVTTSQGLTEAELKQELLQLAEDEGLDYALIVRKIKPLITCYNPNASGSFLYLSASSMMKTILLSKPIAIYRISVTDGSEELVRTVDLGNIPLSALRKISGVSKDQLSYNTLASTGSESLMGGFHLSRCSGIAASFIVPTSILFQELEVKQEQRSYTPKLPVVPNPLQKELKE